MITKEETLKMSEFAKIKINDKEAERFTADINDILAFVDMIYEEEHENVEFCGLNNLKNCLREDIVKPSLENEQILSGTKYKDKGYFVLMKGV